MRTRDGVDLWDYHVRGEWIGITTNRAVNAKGHAVMGRGVALQAAEVFPTLPRELGERLTGGITGVVLWTPYRLVTFPVKEHWRDDADLDLIRESATALQALLDSASLVLPVVYLPRPGCGNGRLRWPDVKAALAPILSDRVVVVTNQKEM